MTFMFLSFSLQALTKFLKSVNWKVPQEAKQALDLLNKWSPMDVDDALELLSPAFVNPAVRKYAVTRLQQADDEVWHCVHALEQVALFFAIRIATRRKSNSLWDLFRLLTSECLDQETSFLVTKKHFRLF